MVNSDGRRHLRLVIGPDSFGSLLERFSNVWIDSIESGVDRCRIDYKAVERHAVEPLGVRTDRVIAVGAHASKNLSYDIDRAT
jgi:hypothetical protein